MARNYTRLATTHRTLVRGAQILGPVQPATMMDITVEVKGQGCPEDFEAEYQQMIGRHPAERRPLSREELKTKYGAPMHSLDAVAAVAREFGVEILSQSVLERTIKLRGMVANLTRMFPASLQRMSHPLHGEFIARTGELQVPSELAAVITGVFGFDTRRQARSHHIRREIFSSEQEMSAAHSATSRSWFTAAELANIYDFPAGDGANQCIAFLEFGGGFDEGDLTAYFAKLNAAKPNIFAVPVDGVMSSPNSIDPYDQNATGEVMLDLEVAGALAPKAKLAVYFAPFTERGWIDALKAAIHDTKHKPSVVSISWGWPELQDVAGDIWTTQAMQSIAQTLKEAALLGITVCVAAGDHGCTDGLNDGKLHVDYPSSDVAVLACGGTTLKTNPDRTAIQQEFVWSGGTRETGTGSTGGGFSQVWAKPVWQNQAIPEKSESKRGVPDVAAVADPNTGYLTISNHRWGISGGTSAVAPLMAALIARINQHAQAPVGSINTVAYATPNAFHGIVQGDNKINGVGYDARQGWDPCTGLGTPIGSRLQAALLAARRVAA